MTPERLSEIRQLAATADSEREKFELAMVVVPELLEAAGESVTLWDRYAMAALTGLAANAFLAQAINSVIEDHAAHLSAQGKVDAYAASLAIQAKSCTDAMLRERQKGGE